MVNSAPFVLDGTPVPPGRRRSFEFPAGRLPTGTSLEMAVEVVHGVEPGPTVWLSGAVHGDEIVGVEIIRQVLERLDPKSMAGTVLAVPVVNVFGFVTESRYLPDRRDLNRSFPGSRSGSQAARLARLFVEHVVTPSDVGIDFHAGSDDRTNLAHLRVDLDDEETRRLATAFGAPLMMHAKPIRGSLRETARKRGKKILVFEGGEPRRFSRRAVETGVPGTLRVLGALGMLEAGPVAPLTSPLEARRSKWVRAPRGGLLRLEVLLGQRVDKGDRLGIITDPAARKGSEVRASTAGIVLGHTVSPVVHLGDGLVHLAEVG